ncbi:CaiB/BaiF CoA transferase family protein [Parasphingorhabdus sp.]|uniref:CaiB/BaiF CoA transferase family protein n=1 Tax=Parasphingorhabdus sp. TaxID=2709688 RepID=UPI003A905599
MEKADFYKDVRADCAGPCEGLVVIEMTTSWAGPMAGCILADFGAQVIKVEHPGGEVMRRQPIGIPGSDLMILHETVNRNKHSVSLDLHDAGDREEFLKLCASADIVIENFRPGTLESWGMGYKDIAEIKPDIIYVSISGFGQFGELSDRACYDPIAQNYCGWTSIAGGPDQPPMKAPTFLGDDLAGLHGALGALAALRHRERTGEGQHVDVSLIDSLLSASNGNLTAGAYGIKIPKTGNEHQSAMPSNVFECKDGSAYIATLLDSHWDSMAALIGRPDLEGLKLAQRLERRVELNKILADWCIRQPVDFVVEAFASKGLAVTRVNSFAEVAREEHIASRDMLQSVRLSDGVDAPLTGPAVKFSRTPTSIRSAAPAIGQHNSKYIKDK